MKGSDDAGKFLLRLTVGGLMIFHGIAKTKAGGTDGIAGLLAGKGFPEFLLYGVFIGELLAPAMIIAGFFTRTAAWILAGNMVFAIYLAHMDHLGSLNEKNGAWAVESAMFFLLTSASVALIGPGSWTIPGFGDGQKKGGGGGGD